MVFRHKFLPSTLCIALLLGGCGGGSSSDNAVSITPPPVVATPPASTTPTTPTPAPTAPVSGRFTDRIFDDVERTSNIVFGQAPRQDGTQILEMDIYTPVGDSETQRPVLILAFGGGFTSGFRRDLLITTIANEFAQRGFVTASIDYRLLEETPTTQDEVEIGIIEAMHDMKAAVRFMREDALGANIYGTRPDAVFVGGVSAGAIMASFSGALDNDDVVTEAVGDFLAANNGLDGNSSTNTEISSDVQAIFSLSGAVTDPNWIDERTAPIYAAHEEFDTVVPCRFSMASSGAFLAGGCDMVEGTSNAGVAAELFLVEGSDNHIGYSLFEYIDIFEEAAAFLATQIPE